MASPTINILINIQTQLQQLNQTVSALQSLQTTTTNLGTSSAASIGAWSGAFTVAFQGIQEAAKKTAEILVNFLEGFVKKAAEIQTEEFPLTQMLKDNGLVAKEVLEGMTSLWQQVGVISNESMARAARSLLLMNVPADNLISRLQDLGKISVATGEQVDQVAGAYQRVRQGIEKDVAPAVRGVGAFGLSTLAIFQALEDHFGRLAGTARISEGELVSMFQGGKVSIDDLNKSLEEAAAAGGRFGDVFEQKKATFDGAIMAMQTAWQGFQAAVGKPFLDWATPIINQITVIEKAFAEFATKHAWQESIKLAWLVLMDEVVLIIEAALNKASLAIVEGLTQGFDAAEKVMKDFWRRGVFGGISIDTILGTAATAGQAFSSGFSNALTNNLPSDIEKNRAKLDAMVERLIKQILGHAGTWVEEGMNEIWNEFLANPPPLPPLPAAPEETHRADTAKRLSEALHELELVMNHIRAEQSLIATEPFMGMDEKRVATIKAVENEMENLQKQLVNLQKQKDTLPLNPAQAAELNVRIQAASDKFRALGQQLMTLTHPLMTELNRWANSFGTTAQQIGKTIEGSITAAFQSLNQWILTGKFSVEELEKSLVSLGLQLVEQLLIQQAMALINAALGLTIAKSLGAGISASMAGPATLMTIATEGEAAAQAPFSIAAAIAAVMASSVIGAKKGGRIDQLQSGGFVAGYGTEDTIPAMLAPGEYVINRSSAQSIGYSTLDELNAMAAGGIVHAGRHFYQEAIGGFGGGDAPGTGPQVEIMREPWWYSAGFDNPMAARAAGYGMSGYGGPGGLSWMGRNQLGYMPPPWSPGFSQGPTLIPTTLGRSGYPMAVPVQQTMLTADAPFSSFGRHKPTTQPASKGGRIHLQSGGAVGGRGGGIHIYAFTDLKALTRHMASREGQKIIFDTVKGRRIDLGI